MATIQSGSNIGSSSSSAGDEIVVTTSVPSASSTPAPTTTTTGATCACGANGVARSCYECLNTKLEGGETCVIDPFGECLSTGIAASFRPYFNLTYYAGIATNSSANPHDNQFYWSTNATYCRSDDVACSRCRTTWTNEFHSDMLKSNFSCVGNSDCICTAYCELRGTSDITLSDSYNIDQKVCPFSPTRLPTSSDKLPKSVATLVSGVVLSLLILRYGADYFFHKRDERRLRARHRALRERDNGTGGFGIMLTLDGWNGYRAQLIECEQRSLGLNSESTRVHTEAAPRIIVQEDEGFRPASPSELARQRSTQES